MQVKTMESINDGPSWIYANHHGLNPTEFLSAARAKILSEYGLDGDEAPGLADIQEVWFQRMSPTEARSNSIDWGVWLRTAPERGAYPVTLVEA